MTESKDKFVKLLEEFYDDESLSLVEFVLLSRIESLDNCNRGCFMSNDKLGKFIRRSGKTTANIISKLRNNGYIIDLNENNHGRRGLRVVSRENETTFPSAGNNIPAEMKVVSRENEQSRKENKNTLKDKGEEEAPPEVEKEEVSHIERFGSRIAIEFQLYNLFKELDPNTHTGKATRGELNDLKSLSRDIKEHLQEVKKREGFAGYAVRPEEVIQHFRDFYSRLEDSVKNTKFTCNHMKWNYADLRKKQSQKGRSNNSNSVLKQVQNIPDYKIEKRKK